MNLTRANLSNKIKMSVEDCYPGILIYKVYWIDYSFQAVAHDLIWINEHAS